MAFILLALCFLVCFFLLETARNFAKCSGPDLKSPPESNPGDSSGHCRPATSD